MGDTHQHDGYNCGIWVAKTALHWRQFHEEGNCGRHWESYLRQKTYADEDAQANILQFRARMQEMVLPVIERGNTDTGGPLEPGELVIRGTEDRQVGRTVAPSHFETKEDSEDEEELVRGNARGRPDSKTSRENTKKRRKSTTEEQANSWATTMDITVPTEGETRGRVRRQDATRQQPEEARETGTNSRPRKKTRKQPRKARTEREKEATEENADHAKNRTRNWQAQKKTKYAAQESRIEKFSRQKAVQQEEARRSQAAQ
ncbi:hypothetical protein CYMTET_46764 [Cymbomonas tetramitiformis]|uniref:Uncharacterized protein n=1 Tax=Cymbomonas tetramitiformis TaxID=36881 RepID=A0AAE0EX99_9CHLO|nr:hypothetical protein CYMTET_46764 [Cymbomonas tetramitiformis]